MYNLTGIMASNESGMLTFITDVNTILMNSMLGNIFLLGFSIILFSSFWLSTADVSKSLMGTSLIIFMLSLSFVAIGLCHPIIPLIAAVLLVLGIIFTR